MPPEAISLALAASIYPPAVAAVIALGRGTEVRLRVFLLVGTAMLTVFVTGAAMLLVFDELRRLRPPPYGERDPRNRDRTGAPMAGGPAERY